MTRSQVVCLLVCCGLFFAACSGPRPRTIPMEDYARLTTSGHPAWIYEGAEVLYEASEPCEVLLIDSPKAWLDWVNTENWFDGDQEARWVKPPGSSALDTEEGRQALQPRAALDLPAALNPRSFSSWRPTISRVKMSEVQVLPSHLRSFIIARLSEGGESVWVAIPDNSKSSCLRPMDETLIGKVPASQHRGLAKPVATDQAEPGAGISRCPEPIDLLHLTRYSFGAGELEFDSWDGESSSETTVRVSSGSFGYRRIDPAGFFPRAAGSAHTLDLGADLVGRVGLAEGDNSGVYVSGGVQGWLGYTYFSLSPNLKTKKLTGWGLGIRLVASVAPSLTHDLPRVSGGGGYVLEFPTFDPRTGEWSSLGVALMSLQGETDFDTSQIFLLNLSWTK